MTVVGMAANGRDALDQIKKLSPHVAVIDITMPELNGIETTRHLAESCPSTRVIILSMHSGMEQILRALQAGAKGYILKESTGADIVEAIRTVNNGGFFLSDGVLEKIVDYNIREHIQFEGRKVESVLSGREWEILQLTVEGKSTSAIAETLNISPKTVNTYRYRIMEKLNITGVPGLVKFAIQNGITRPQ
jgi:DNA-binding NarL/FixJ family response regulator